MPRLRNNKKSSFSLWKKGLTLPGYNYLGPFNSLDNGEPTNASDKAAQKHDHRYKMYQQVYGGYAPYFRYSKADEDFINEVGRDWGGQLGKGFFKLKRKFYESGLVSDLDMEKKPRLGDARRNKRLREPSIEPTVKKVKSDRSGNLIKPRSLPLSNFQRSAQAGQMSGAGSGSGSGDGNGSGNAAGLKETPIDEVSGWVHRGPPNYTFASLPHLTDNNWNLSATTVDFMARMTSVYDPLVSISTVDLNAGAGAETIWRAQVAEPDATVRSARWFTLYSGMYNYYHVIGCRWHLTIENYGGDDIWLHQMYCSASTPPEQATNEDMLCWPDCKSYYIGTHHKAVTSLGYLEQNDRGTAENLESNNPSTTPNFETGNNIVSRAASPILQVSGEYKTGDFRREIIQDSEVENWTAVTTNPILTERCLWRVTRGNNYKATSSANSSDGSLALRFFLRLEYLVEFKELKDGLRWPVQRQPLTVTINQDVTSATL